MYLHTDDDENLNDDIRFLFFKIGILLLCIFFCFIIYKDTHRRYEPFYLENKGIISSTETILQENYVINRTTLLKNNGLNAEYLMYTDDYSEMYNCPIFIIKTNNEEDYNKEFFINAKVGNFIHYTQINKIEIRVSEEMYEILMDNVNHRIK